MLKILLPFFLIFLVIISSYGFNSNKNNFTLDNPTNKFQSFTDTIQWNFSFFVSVSKEPNYYVFSIKTNFTLHQTVTFKSLTIPPTNIILDSSNSSRFWCLCPPQHSQYNVTYRSFQIQMYTTSFPIDSSMFPNSDNYTFHIYQMPLNQEFNFNPFVNVNGSDYSFPNSYQSYSGFSTNFNIYTTSLSSATTSISSISTISAPLNINWIVILPALLTFFLLRKKNNH